MERLTKKDCYGHWYTNEKINDRMQADEPYPHAYDGKPIDKLADYEDKQEQGLLIELPCKVGDTVYRFCGAKGRKYVDIRYVNNITYRLDYKGDVMWEIFTTTTDVFGKTVFLTRSEAEEALAKMGGSRE